MYFLVLIWVSLGLLIPYAEGAGSQKSKTPAIPTTVRLQTAKPVRKVRLLPVGSLPFRLPNGSTIDTSLDLTSIFESVVTESRFLSPLKEFGSTEPCLPHLELRARLTTMELNVRQFKITIGFSPSGSFDVPPLKGSLETQIGTMAMDFSLWHCESGKCWAVASANEDHRTSQVSGFIGIDLDLITIGPSFVRNTSFGKTVRQIMKKGIETLESNAHFQELAWHSTITRATPTEPWILQAGLSDRINSGDSFVIYRRATESVLGATCPVYQPIALAHASSVQAQTSTLEIDSSNEFQIPVPGDWVMIRRP